MLGYSPFMQNESRRGRQENATAATTTKTNPHWTQCHNAPPAPLHLYCIQFPQAPEARFTPRTSASSDEAAKGSAEQSKNNRVFRGGGRNGGNGGKGKSASGFL